MKYYMKYPIRSSISNLSNRLKFGMYIFRMKLNLLRSHVRKPENPFPRPVTILCPPWIPFPPRRNEENPPCLDPLKRNIWKP